MDRRYDVDWLRVCATYLLFVFHVGKVFDPAPFYHIRNADLSFWMLTLCGFILFGVKAKACPLPARPVAAVTTGVVSLFAIAVATPAHAAQLTPLGVWYAEGGAAKVALERCGTSLCGTVVWLRSPWDEDGCEMRDRYNPDPSLRDRPVVGLQIVTGFTPDSSADGIWDGGSIYDPGSGKTYRCQAWLDGPDRLELRGYVGIPLFGRTTRWIREGSENRMCKEHAAALHAAVSAKR
jgi:uncharacterized protein (DUF2147 family)